VSAYYVHGGKAIVMGNTRAIFLSLVLEANDDGYLASVPGIQGAFAEGDTIEEAIFNCIDVVKMIVAYRTERGECLGFNEVLGVRYV